MIIIVWGTSEEPRFLFRSGGVRAEVTHQLSDKTRQRRIYKVPRPSSQGCLFSSSGFETTCESNKARGVAAGSGAAAPRSRGTARPGCKQICLFLLLVPRSGQPAPRAAPKPRGGKAALGSSRLQKLTLTPTWRFVTVVFLKQHHHVSLHKVCCCC